MGYGSHPLNPETSQPFSGAAQDGQQQRCSGIADSGPGRLPKSIVWAELRTHAPVKGFTQIVSEEGSRLG